MSAAKGWYSVPALTVILCGRAQWVRRNREELL